MTIEVEAVLTTADYDAALNAPGLPGRMTIFAIWLGVAAFAFPSIGVSLLALGKSVARTFQDHEHMQNVLRSAVLYWVVPALLVLTPITIWYVYYLARQLRNVFSAMLRPKDRRQFRDGLHLGPARYTLARDGFTMRTRRMRLHYPWSAFAGVEDAPGRLRLPYATSDGCAWATGMFIPARAFANDRVREEAARYAAARISEARI